MPSGAHCSRIGGGPHMNSVGIDLHKRRSQIAVLSEDARKLLSRRIDNDPATFLELLSEIDGESKIAVEATYGWEWLADVLEEAGYELHLAHPLRTKAIASARVKTDSVDSLTPAHLLRADLLPEAYIARASCATCATCFATAWRSRTCARRSRTASTRCCPARGFAPGTRICSARPGLS